MASSCRKYAGRQVAIATIANDEHDRRVLDLLGDLQCDPTRAGGRNAGEETVLAGEPARHLFGVALAHVDHLVDPRRVVDFRQIRLGPFADAGDARALGRLRADHAYRLALLLQEARHAGDRSGGAHRADEVGDLAVGVAPDLGAGRLVVDTRVVVVGELVEHTPLAVALHLLGEVARVFHATGSRRADQLGTECLHRLRAPA